MYRVGFLHALRATLAASRSKSMRTTRSLLFESLDSRQLLAVDGFYVHQWGASCTGDSYQPSASVAATSSSFAPSSTPTAPQTVTGSIATASTNASPTTLTVPTTTIPTVISGPTTNPPTTNPPTIGPTTPGAKPEVTLSVYDSDLHLATQIDEGNGLWVVVAVRGGNPTSDVVTISVDANFNGLFEVTERQVLIKPNSINGLYSVFLSVPDDGPFPGNSTRSDQLRIRAQVNDVVKTAEVTVNNVAPVIVAIPVITRAISSNNRETITVRVTFADPGLYDRHTATVVWSDNSVTSSSSSRDEAITCNGVATRSIELVYSPASGSRVIPMSVMITDDDGASGRGDGSDLRAVYNFHYLDVAVNRDDDNQSQISDMAESLVAGEDDVLPADLSQLLKSHMTSTTGSFSFTYDTNTIRVWDSADKRNMIRPTSSGIPTLGPPSAVSSIPYTGQEQVFVEGIAPGRSSITLSWLPSTGVQTNPFPRCQPPSPLNFGGSVDVTVWSIDVDIDSDNNGVLEHSAWEEELEDHEFALGKLLYWRTPLEPKSAQWRSK